MDHLTGFLIIRAKFFISPTHVNKASTQKVTDEDRIVAIDADAPGCINFTVKRLLLEHSSFG